MIERRVRWYQRPLHEYLVQGGKRAILEGQARAQEIAASAAAREQEFNFREREHQFRLLEMQRQDEFDRAKHAREMMKRGEGPPLTEIPAEPAAA